MSKCCGAKGDVRGHPTPEALCYPPEVDTVVHQVSILDRIALGERQLQPNHQLDTFTGCADLMASLGRISKPIIKTLGRQIYLRS
jgi:hypothetical protein